MGRHSDSSEEDGSPDSQEELSSEEEERLRRSSKKSKSSSKKKKSKDKKKHKKRSKKHRRRSTSSETESDSEGEDEWVVKAEVAPAKVKVESGEEEGVFKKPKFDAGVNVATCSKVEKEQDEGEWMGFGDALQTYSNDSKRSERRKQKDKEREAKSIDKLGQHVNELNPYWKDGGTGLPDEETQSKQKEASSQMIGDGGLNYLRKAFVRAKEQAAEEGRKLEDVVSERWGSLERFLGMLEEAENKAKEKDRKSDRDRDRDDYRDRSKRFVRPSRDSDDEDDRRSSNSSRSHRYDRHRDRDRERVRRKSRSRERESGWRKRRSPDRSTSSVKESSSSSRSEKKEDVRATPTTDKHASSSQFKLPESLEGNSGKVAVSSSYLPDDEPMEVEKEAPKVLTDKEMNELNAKLLKAEMFGNTALMDELKAKISEAEKARQYFIKNGGDPSKPQSSAPKIVTKVVMDNSRDRGRRKDKVTETHKDGQRVRYFPDDDKYTLQNMFQKEKMNTAADENALFARLAGKGAKTGQDYDVDDVFTDRASSSKQSSKEQEREIRDVLDKEKQYKKVLDNCPWCFEGSLIEKHLILSIAEKSYLCVPPYQSMAEGHCLIVPMAHVSCATELDEDVWAEMQKFRKALVRMFREADQDMVIFETALFLKRHPHMYLECIPMPKETGELAPIYFKKAIQECEKEWSQNKKLVELRNRDVRRAIPKGLPYFSVDFGDDSCGFAHVVEDEKDFPRNFAHEIVGGMMELDHHLWRKQKKDDFKTQRNKVMEFLKTWASYDWTRDAE